MHIGIVVFVLTMRQRKNYFKKNIGTGDQVANSYFVDFISFFKKYGDLA